MLEYNSQKSGNSLEHPSYSFGQSSVEWKMESKAQGEVLYAWMAYWMWKIKDGSRIYRIYIFKTQIHLNLFVEPL